jgi:hypothetical protein
MNDDPYDEGARPVFSELDRKDFRGPKAAGGEGKSLPCGGARQATIPIAQGEEGLSVFDAGHVKPEDILPAFRPGSLVVSRDVEWLESFGLQVVNTPGDPGLPKLCRTTTRLFARETG